MRVKELWNRVPLSTTLKLVWDRITFSKLTVAYFGFSFLHAILQLSLQIKAFTVNANAASFLNSIVIQGKATKNSLPLLRGPSLYMCDSVSSDLSLDGCHIVWNGTKGSNVIGTHTQVVADVPGTSSLYLTSTASASTSVTVSSTSSAAHSTTTGLSSTSHAAVTIFVLPTPTSVTSVVDKENLLQDDGEVLASRAEAHAMAIQGNGQTQVQIDGMGFDHISATLNRKCLVALSWPVFVLGDTKREDLVFVAFQLWVLGISIAALLNESIPHILASLVTHMMATAWAAFKITNTANFRSDFNRVVTHGACNGTSLLPEYWRDRGEVEIPSLVLNAFAMLASCYLTWKLIKLFGWQTFKRVGASLTINRVYQIVLVLSIAIQLCLFFILVTVSLWLDQLFNKAVENQITFKNLYKITSIITLVLTIPWLTTGWFAVRRELRAPMFIFLMLSFLYLGGWSVMFFSTTFRWTFVTWRFFSIMATASVFLTLVCFVLGVVCRFNFGKGLRRYLNTHQDVHDSDVYNGSSDIEKFEFPAKDRLIPTYSADFQASHDVPPPSLWFVTRGPRFFNKLAQPFETIARPQAAHTLTRNTSDGSSHGHLLARGDSLSSNGSHESGEGHYPDSKHARWLIE